MRICPFMNEECLIDANKEDKQCYFDVVVGKTTVTRGCAIILALSALAKQVNKEYEVSHYHYKEYKTD